MLHTMTTHNLVGEWAESVDLIEFVLRLRCCPINVLGAVGSFGGFFNFLWRNSEWAQAESDPACVSKVEDSFNLNFKMSNEIRKLCSPISQVDVMMLWYVIVWHCHTLKGDALAGDSLTDDRSLTQCVTSTKRWSPVDSTVSNNSTRTFQLLLIGLQVGQVWTLLCLPGSTFQRH